VRGAESSIASANETEHWAERDLARMEDLAAKQLVPRKMLDDARHALAEARMQRDSALAQQSQAAAALGGNPSRRCSSCRSTVRAGGGGEGALRPRAGERVRAGRRHRRHARPAGRRIPQPGQVAMPLVATAPVWIEANFKETDLARLRVGQRAQVRSTATRA
jgi:membrane fusion protein (multidrug efflux system)